MKILRNISRIITGSVFIFSGTVKAIDPLGTAYKFQDYFQAFGIGFAKDMGLPLAIALFTIEFIAVLSIISGYRYKEGVWTTLILMMIFTPLTLILAIANPVSDCGCFGDAIHLTNWQTFWKNIILSVFVLILFIDRQSIRTILTAIQEWTVLIFATALFITFSIYNLTYLPVIDFLPYNTGANIPEKMIIPEGMPVDKYETTFIYEKDGMQKEFTLDNYPANDSTWKFVDQKSVLVEKGYVPPVHDFSITTMQNEDITGKILSDPGYTLLMITRKLSKAEEKDLAAGFDLGQNFLNGGSGFYILTASTSDEIMKYGESLPFCLTDETTLKTMIRANPGYIILRNGTIVGKWSHANLPAKEWFSKDMSGRQIERLSSRSGLFIMITIALSAALVLLIMHISLKKEKINYTNI